MELATFTLTSLELGTLVGLLAATVSAMVRSWFAMRKAKETIQMLATGLDHARIEIEAQTLVLKGITDKHKANAAGLQARAKLYDFPNTPNLYNTAPDKEDDTKG